MPRSREKIMSEWDTVRMSLAGGCDHSGPRDWFEGVMDEQDHIIAGLVREISRLQYFEESAAARRSWTDEAKRAAGYHTNVSFDDVWRDALAALLAKRDAETVR